MSEAAASTVIGQFRSVTHVVTAIQWTGENLAAVQWALSPSSPLYDGRAEGKARVLTVMVRDTQNEKLYPSLGRQTKGAVLQPGDWLVWMGADDLRVVGDAEFQRGYVAVAPARYLVDTAEDGTEEAQPAARAARQLAEAKDV